MEDPSHGFLVSRWFVHYQFLDLDNLFDIVVHQFLIGGMVDLSHRVKVLMISALVGMVTHWIWVMLNHDTRLSGSHEFIKLLHCIVS